MRLLIGSRACQQAGFFLLAAVASCHAAVELTNGSFETIEGTTLILPAPQYDIFKPAGWDILTEGTPWDAGSSSVTGVPGNFDAIDAGHLTGARYLRLASDSADSGFGAVAQNLGNMVAGETYTIKADVFGGNGNIDWTGVVELRSTGDNTSGTVYASDIAGPASAGVFIADDFTVSYTATAGDGGNPLWVRFAVDSTAAPVTAMRGAIDNVRLTVGGSAPDTTPPVLLSAASPDSRSTVVLTFDEPVNLSAASFTIAGGSVTGFAAGATAKIVVLSVTGLTPGGNYTVTAANVKDTAGNTLVSGTAGFTAGPAPGVHALVNGSFEDTYGDAYANGLFGGFYEATGWTNLTIASDLKFQAVSFLGSNPPNDEFPVGLTGITGDRYLRLVSDTDNAAYVGRTAQAVGLMTAGETYTLSGDAFGGPGSDGTNPVPYGIKAAFTNAAAVSPSATYASQTVSGLANGQFQSGAISLSYTATAADDGQPLVVWLEALPTLATQATRGGVDNLNLVISQGDSTPPVLQSASFTAPGTVTLTFDEAVDISSAVFTVAGGTVTAASPGLSPNTVVLTVTGLTTGASYTVVATNVKDTSGNTAATGSTGFTAGGSGSASLDILSVTNLGSGNIRILFSTAAGRTYQLESSANLSAWTSFGSTLSAAGASLSADVPLAAGTRFWRVRLLP